MIHTQKNTLWGCVLVYRYTKERNINELRHNSMYGYENNRNSHFGLIGQNLLSSIELNMTTFLNVTI